MGGRTSNKAAYFDKLKTLLEEYVGFTPFKPTVEFD